MNRIAHRAVSLAAAAVALAAGYLLPGAGAGLAVANGVAYGAFAWLAVAHADLLLRGGQPWPVARWSGLIGGFSVLGPLTVLTVALPSAPAGERVAVAALVFATTWTGVGLGVSLARTAAEVEGAWRDPWEQKARDR